ncbi:MAG: hypothetical protein LUH42_05470 [Oscillospiraceae bacterium]|nr:hypothetical protein [Oscillospiraceae bacterium]
MEQTIQSAPAAPEPSAARTEPGVTSLMAEQTTAQPAPQATQPAPQATQAPQAMPPETDPLAAERAALAGQRERNRMERARLAAEEQVRQISQLDGRIKSLDDLIAMPEYGAFYSLVRKGADLVQAYKATCCDRLMQQAAEAASRQTMRSVASRQHLTALAGQPGETSPSTVPAEVAAEFRLAKPGISDQEIRRKWRKYQAYKRQ